MLAFIDSNLFTWVILPLLIFLARIGDVGLDTIRIILISRGYKYLAPVVGFVQVLIWLLAIGQIMQNLTQPICYIAYAAGFASGTYIGMHIAQKMSLGLVLVRIVTKRDAHQLIESLKNSDYGVTSVPAQGNTGPVHVVFTIVPRPHIAQVVQLIEEFNPNAFFSVEEVNSVREGVFPKRKSWNHAGFFNFLRPTRRVL
jgi:uncharacterized protein YebE (UPF0316 family)